MSTGPADGGLHLGVGRVYSCEPTSCRRVLETGASWPVLEVRGGERPVVFVWTRASLWRSTDGGRSFQALGRPGGDRPADILAVAVGPGGRLAALDSGLPSALYVSDDDGASWAARTDPANSLLRDVAVLSDGALLAAPDDGGIRCSDDGGATWADRCRSPSRS